MQTDEHEPAESPRTEPTPSARRNHTVTAFIYDAAIVVLFLLGLPCFIIALVVSDRSFANTMFGVCFTLTALGMAGLGLSSAALYRHPDWQLPAFFALFPGRWLGAEPYAPTHGERTFPLAWFGSICAVAAAAAALVVFAYPLSAVPAAFWLGAAALYVIALVPLYGVRLRAWRRTLPTRSISTR